MLSKRNKEGAPRRNHTHEMTVHMHETTVHTHVTKRLLRVQTVNHLGGGAHGAARALVGDHPRSWHDAS